MENQLQDPIPLPKNSPITSVITDYFYREVCTGSRKLTISKARNNQYWFINNNCVGCRKPCNDI